MSQKKSFVETNSEFEEFLQRKDKRLLKRLPWNREVRNSYLEALGVGQSVGTVNVKFLRSREKLSQKDFCEIYQISPSTLKSWEAGQEPSHFAILYLKLIKQYPDLVRKSLRIKA